MLFLKPRRPGGRSAAMACLLAIVMVCPAGVAVDRLPGLPAAKAERVQHAILREMERHRIPGLSVAIAVDLRVAWSEGFGMADLENAVPAKPATAYRLGSISKPITAVAVMQLAEQGKLDLDAPIQKYVPSFPQKQWPVTARDVLAHISGIRHYRTLDEVNSTRHYDNLLDPLKIFQFEPLLFEPRTSFHYSTYGYTLLGAAVESASGMGFLDYLRQSIFAPAGMQAIWQDDSFNLVPNRARGYRRGAGGEIQNCALADTSNKIPGGGLIATPEEAVRFATALNRGQLLSRATLKEMFAVQRTQDGKPTRYGLGWRVWESGGRRWVGHSGAQQGVSTLLLVLPSEGFAIGAMANLEGVDLSPLCGQIAEVVLQ